MAKAGGVASQQGVMEKERTVWPRQSRRTVNDAVAEVTASLMSRPMLDDETMFETGANAGMPGVLHLKQRSDHARKGQQQVTGG